MGVGQHPMILHLKVSNPWGAPPNHHHFGFGFSINHRIHVCYIYGNIYHQYTPMLAYIPYMESYGL